MAEWFYSQYGQTKGPVSESTLINMVLKEELELDDYVMNPKDELWKKIKDTQHLLDKIHEPEKAIPQNINFGANFLNSNDVRVGNLYFYIPIKRFVIMTVLSLGLYEFYWFYKQWYYWACKHKQGYRSPDRELSWILFPWTIFQKIETDKEMNAVVRADFNGAVLFWMWAGFGLFMGMLMFGIQSFGRMNSILYYLSGVADIIFLIPIQRYINRVNDKLGNTYDKPGFGHYLCIAAGIMLIALAISAFQIRKLFQV